MNSVHTLLYINNYQKSGELPVPGTVENARQRIIESAKQLLIENKDGDFTIRDVARRCGIALGTVYNYYDSKAELIVIIVAQMWDACFDEMRKITSTDFYECIRQVYDILKSYVESFSKNFMYRLASLSSVDKQLSQSYNNRYFTICKGLLTTMIEQHAERFDKQLLVLMSMDGLAGFILTHLLNIAMKGADYDQFDYVLHKLLA